ncbi:MULTISPECIES: transaldolase [Micromonospora]|uniref:Transaldolase n=1 Tax=Micromonospora zamorensis TaxID=709883 RepID=A0ABZ1PJS4_9ACTN|nr:MULTISPECIES: transaldolase [Micromonospora]MBQ0978939.1 transaldolase [Micromonospora sp. M61]MBQ1039610.1 transaldolase [Micromonospora sp. C81]TQJ23989.1 transaldolase [Micromonospora sp. A202]WSK50099.1 transaldolase [Micromonospora zamorensis]WTE87349.1 transaldolase [Micromonospora zamorensis]
MTDKLNELTAAGVAVWLDDLSRVRLSSGGLDQLRREKHVAGVTTNPTIFAKALSDADEYNWQLRDLATRGIEVEESVRMLTTYDVRWACDVMRPSYDGSAGVDGRVSIEVDPRVAHDSDRTVAEAKALWWLVDRPNLFIKIPATEEGLSAITDTLAEGISVNVTLIFGLDRYSAVMEAFLAGLEKAKANGHDLSTIGSVASFFVSRVDAEVDKRLEKIGSEQAKSLRGKAAVANAQLAYERYTEVFSSDRWKALADAGAHPQRPLWASTSTKNPDYRDVIYVEELIAPGTVNTMPESVIHAYADHGETRGDTITGAYDAARKVFADLESVGVDMADVIATLEREGVEKFEASWQELLDGVRKSLEAAAKGKGSPNKAAKGNAKGAEKAGGA